MGINYENLLWGLNTNRGLEFIELGQEILGCWMRTVALRVRLTRFIRRITKKLDHFHYFLHSVAIGLVESLRTEFQSRLSQLVGRERNVKS